MATFGIRAREIDNRPGLQIRAGAARSPGAWEKLKMQIRRDPLSAGYEITICISLSDREGATWSSGIVRVHLITGFYVRALETKE